MLGQNKLQQGKSLNRQNIQLRNSVAKIRANMTDCKQIIIGFTMFGVYTRLKHGERDEN